MSGVPGRIVNVRGGGSGVGVEMGRDGSSEDGGGVVLGAPVDDGARFGDEDPAFRLGLAGLLGIGASVTATGIGVSVGDGSGLADVLGLGLGATMFSRFGDDQQASCSNSKLTNIEPSVK